VGSGATLKDCIVAGDNHIEDNSHIEGAAINNKVMAKK
jgi:ADP-glucose pyrophosphorylase